VYKILAVDDEPEICKIIDKFLTKKGYCVMVAYSGEEALARLDREKMDLIILDKKMSGIGGLGVLHELKRRKSGIPVIILTGSLGARDEEAKEMGSLDILHKPIDLNQLLEKVNHRLAKA